MSPGLIVLSSLVVALALVAFGIFRVVTQALRLKKRFLALSRHPMLGLGEPVEMRAGQLERETLTLQVLGRRTAVALNDLTVARRGFRRSASAAAEGVRALPDFLIDNLPVLLSTKARTPES